MQSNESAFFRSFSLDEFLAHNESHVGLDCSEGGNATAFSIRDSNSAEFRSNKSEGCSCKIKGDAVASFDEAVLISALAGALEKAIVASGARVIKSGKQKLSSFYFEYALDDRKGRVEISGKNLGSDHYELEANLEER